ncbi:MAG: hypothetical protein HPZ81_06490 [Oscillospiraceae bacterium]|nr:hypothetical protein [Oscillospiraceae bacterium]
MEQSEKPPRSYKELKQKQKAKISDYMYLETQNFSQTNGRMPDTDEDCETVAHKVFNHVSGLRVPVEEIHAVYLRKRPHIIECLTTSGMPGFLFTSVVTVRLRLFLFLIVILLGDRYLCGYSLC